VIVVYPEATWYTYVDREDIEEILTEHLIGGRIVERLRYGHLDESLPIRKD